MKKIIVICIIFLSLYGCQSKSDNTLDNNNSESNVSEGVVIEEADMPKTIEEELYEMYTSEDREALRIEIIKLYKDINLSEYNKIAEKGLMYITQWIANFETYNEEEIKNIIPLYTNVDGAYAEDYAIIIGRIYLQDSLLFIDLLMGYEEDTVDIVCGFLGYNAAYRPEMFIERTEEILNSDKTTSRQKELANIIMEKIEHPYAE